jgi:F-type H+-transporting ATPase subunit b
MRHGNRRSASWPRPAQLDHRPTEQRLGTANAELDARTAEAEQRIAASRSAAMSEINAVAAEAARDIVLRVAGTDVGASDARKAVESVRHGR